VAGAVIIAFVGFGLAMLWTGRTTDSAIVIGLLAVVIGAGYHLLGDSMDEGLDAARSIGGDEPSDGGSDE